MYDKLHRKVRVQQQGKSLSLYIYLADAASLKAGRRVFGEFMVKLPAHSGGNNEQ